MSAYVYAAVRTPFGRFDGGLAGVRPDDLVAPVAGAEDLVRDEGLRPESTPEKLSTLQPSFRASGAITAGNASPLSDGAAALLVGSEAAAARIVGRGAFALDPQEFGYAPVEAANRAMQRAGVRWDEVGAVELNEAFAAQSLVCVDAWLAEGLQDPEIVNTRGGAIAIGHPLGASGVRILGTLAKVLHERGERYGVAAICIGVGQGLAVVLENVEVAG